MSKNPLEKQLEEIKNVLKEIERSSNTELEKKLRVVYSFVLSLLRPDKFTDTEKEDLRRLAQELGYIANTNFSDWWRKNKVLNTT